MKKILFLVAVAFFVSGTVYLIEHGQSDLNASFFSPTYGEQEEQWLEEDPNEVEPIGEVETLDEEESIEEVEPANEVEPINEVEPLGEVEPGSEK